IRRKDESVSKRRVEKRIPGLTGQTRTFSTVIGAKRYGAREMRRLLRLSFILTIAAGAFTACGTKQDGALENNPKAHQYGQEIHLEGSLPRIVASQSIKVPVTVRNTSNFNWTPSGDHPVRFAYHWFDKDRRKVVHDGERTYLAEDLPVGATTKLDAT